MCIYMCVCVCVYVMYTGSFWCTAEIGTTLYINYIVIFLKQKKKKNPRQRYMVRGREMVLGFFVCFILLFMIENDNAKKRGVPVVAQ